MKALLRLENVSLQVGDHLVLGNLNAQLLPNKIGAFVGPNGCGKTLLTKLLCGHIVPAAGQVHYCMDGQHETSWFSRGEVVRVDSADIAGEAMGESHQYRWHLHAGDECTVTEALFRESVFSINPFEVVADAMIPRDFEAHKAALIVLFDLAKLKDRAVSQLSTGERQRLALLRGLLRSPKLLVLDDPFVALDEPFRAQFCDLLESEARTKAIVLTTSRREDLPKSTVLLANLASGIRQRYNPMPRGDRPKSPLMGGVVLKMRQVNVVHRGIRVLEDISLVLHRGERCALVGPNGAGKTTLVSLVLADHPQVYSSDIEILGWQPHRRESIWAIRQKIGFVSPEFHAHFPKETRILDTILSGFFESIGLWQSASSEQADRARLVARDIGLGNYLDHRLFELPGGLQRLALLARAIVKSPSLLVLDEPCQGMDAENRMCVLQAIERLVGDTEMSLLYVSHYADEIPQCVHRLIRLKRGRIVSDAEVTG